MKNLKRNLALGVVVIGTVAMTGVSVFASSPDYANQRLVNSNDGQATFSNDCFGRENGRSFNRKHSGEMKSETIQREVELMENGVVITMTSEDLDEVAEIQERVASRSPQREDSTVVREIENTDNGVVIRLSSKDADEVSRIQKRSERGFGGRGQRGQGWKNGQGRRGDLR